jgi:hypothetical protein
LQDRRTPRAPHVPRTRLRPWGVTVKKP